MGLVVDGVELMAQEPVVEQSFDTLKYMRMVIDPESASHTVRLVARRVEEWSSILSKKHSLAF